MPTILIADDIAEVFELMQMILEPSDIVCAHALDGETALAMHAKTPYDLIIADLSMKPINGLELLEQIREAGDQTPIILMSGHINDQVRARAEELGVTRFLEKPFPMESLEPLVKDCIQP